ncbi:MAG: ferritin-like domain-containing protein [Chloroflexi bacterium]|nr:MAG: ferritin-like domain-containing protein [Chloroflexota bacterium]
MKMMNLEDLYVDQLKDLHNAEKQLVQALPKMAQAASSSELRQGFQRHLEQTRTHVDRLEQIFGRMGISPGNKKCEAMEGLIKEGEEAIQLQGDPNVRDAALIAAAQRVEHYEIAGYGTVRTFANQLGFNDDQQLLQKTLDEEGETDKQLTSLAEGGLFSTGINEEAAEPATAGNRW